MSFERIAEFERALADFTGAPYAVMTDCCTHAIELALRFDRVTECSFTPFTYLSVPMTMHKLGIKYEYYPDSLPERQRWTGEYKFEFTRIWDSARRLERNMYREGQLQCLSFGYDKPLSVGRGGAILTDDVEVYDRLSEMRYDGRDLKVVPWVEQQIFKVGYHYRPTIEEAEAAHQELKYYQQYKDHTPKFKAYPDLRTITIED